MRIFSVSIDERLDQNIDDLSRSLGKSRPEVFVLGITLLKLADEGRDKGYKLALVDSKDQLHKEIILPSRTK